LAHFDVVDLPGRKVPDPFAVRAAAEVLVAQEQTDPAGSA
jgi:hypothetical protein